MRVKISVTIECQFDALAEVCKDFAIKTDRLADHRVVFFSFCFAKLRTVYLDGEVFRFFDLCLGPKIAI